MHHPLIAATLILAALPLVFGSETGFAQGQQGQSQQGLPNFKPPPMAPMKPYQTVAVTLPRISPIRALPLSASNWARSPSTRIKAALGKLVVGQGFFWVQDKDVADKKKSGLDNLATALDLDAKDGSGWEVLGGYANEPTGDALPDKPSVICAPAEPNWIRRRSRP